MPRCGSPFSFGKAFKEKHGVSPKAIRQAVKLGASEREQVENRLRIMQNSDKIVYMNRLVIASENKGKLCEIRDMLGNIYDVVPMSEAGFVGDIEETGETFRENAVIKAQTVAKALNCDALGDDSGLCVDALNGAPGVYSARYAGVHGDDAANRKLLLENMKGKTDRSAKFVCCMALCSADGKTVVGTGETKGKIGYKEEGNNGFGYDSVFVSDDLGKSFGIASEDEKNAISHRKRAIVDLLGKL